MFSELGSPLSLCLLGLRLVLGAAALLGADRETTSSEKLMFFKK